MAHLSRCQLPLASPGLNRHTRAAQGLRLSGLEIRVVFMIYPSVYADTVR